MVMSDYYYRVQSGNKWSKSMPFEPRKDWTGSYYNREKVPTPEEIQMWLPEELKGLGSEELSQKILKDDVLSVRFRRAIRKAKDNKQKPKGDAIADWIAEDNQRVEQWKRKIIWDVRKKGAPLESPKNVPADTNYIAKLRERWNERGLGSK